MIPISAMATGKATVSAKIKGGYGPGRPSRFSEAFRPVVVWNITWRCNLRCKHCYIEAGDIERSELSTREALKLVEQLAEAKTPLIIFSGGEPLVREDLFEVARYAYEQGIKIALSSNGTLITREVAAKLRETGFTYVGISIESPDPEWNDYFRGVPGAFKKAMEGVKACQEEGIDVGFRITLTKSNYREAPRIVSLALEKGVPRICFYHLVPSGRAKEIQSLMLNSEEHQWLLDTLIEEAKRAAGKAEIYTVTAPSDGIYVAGKVSKTREEFLDQLALLKGQGNCGKKLISIYPDGEVHPCQFLEEISLGSVREKPYKEIVSPENPLLKPLTEVEKHLRGPKCSRCPFKAYCGGFRPRALAVYGDLWGDDPCCFFDPWEIARRFQFDPGTEGEPGEPGSTCCA